MSPDPSQLLSAPHFNITDSPGANACPRAIKVKLEKEKEASPWPTIQLNINVRGQQWRKRYSVL